ncbi:MAG TPA: NUDIX hydrolase [Pyrinomonadaceae bacterium]|nr:NUDIX hydrolase [Pyrinomonadaceae bacterium]
MRPGVAILALDDDGFVYLVREFRYALGRQSIEVVSGTIDKGEASLSAARRELHEELGIKAQEFVELGRLDPITSVLDAPTYLFLARGLEFGKKSPDGAEQIETLKFRLADALRMVDSNEITHAQSCALICMASRWLSAPAENCR